MRSGSSLPRLRRRWTSVPVKGVASADSLRYARSVTGSALGMSVLVRPADERICAARYLVQIGFQLRSNIFHRRTVGLRRNPDKVARSDDATPEGQVNNGAIPIIKALDPAGGNGHRKN